MTEKTSSANTKKTMDSAETMENSKEYFSTYITNSEKAVESMIELNSAVYKGSESLMKKMYDNQIANIAATFDGMKALNKTKDAAEFYKVASSNAAAAAERFSDQSKSVAELAGKVFKETGEAGRLAYSKGFAVSK